MTNLSDIHNIKKLTIILFLTISIFLLFNYSNKFTELLININNITNSNSTDNFISGPEIEGKTGNVEQSDGSCQKPDDAGYVGMNYNVCCPKDIPRSNCMCQVNKIKECADIYDKCFNSKVNKFKEIRKKKEDNIKRLELEIQELKKKPKDPIHGFKKIKIKESILKSMKDSLEEEPDVPPGLKKTCQIEFKKCASKFKLNTKSKNNNFQITSMKKNDNTGTRICEVESITKDSIDKCLNYCSNIDGCKGGILNKMARTCSLYDKPLIDKEPGAASGDGSYIPFMLKENFTSLNNNTSRKAKQLLDIIDKKNSNYKTCKNSIIKDMEQLRERYTFKKIDDDLPKLPDFKNQICRMKNVSLSKCETQCLSNDECQYFTVTDNINTSRFNTLPNKNNSNKNVNISSRYKKNNTTCNLYSGYPLYDGDKVSLSKVNKNGDYYLKITRESLDINL